MKLKNITKKYLADKRLWLILIASFGLGHFASADMGTIEKFVASVLASIVACLVWVFGAIMSLEMSVLKILATYNSFVNEPIVINGWVVMRDFCNMFFILILLVIAFATILQIEGYTVKKLLPRLLIMAVLVNFSRLICGFLIDFAQIIMLSFVNAFSALSDNNLVNMLGLTQILEVKDAAVDVSFWNIVAGYILALLYLMITVVVLLVIVASLAIRIIMLWLYVILSPLAYLLGVIPATKAYANRWWKDFTENLITGPLLAFFLWLSFTSVTTNNFNIPAGGQDPMLSMSGSSTAAFMLKFVIGIGLLIAGLMITNEVKGLAGSASKKITGTASKWGKKLGKTAAKNTGRAAGRGVVGGAGGLMGLAGGKEPAPEGSFRASWQKGSKFTKDWHDDMKATRDKEKEESRRKTLEKIGMREKAMASGKVFLEDENVRKASVGIKAATLGVVGAAAGQPLAILAALGYGTGGVGSKKAGGFIKNFAKKKADKEKARYESAAREYEATKAQDLQAPLAAAKTAAEKKKISDDYDQAHPNEIAKIAKQQKKSNIYEEKVASGYIENQKNKIDEFYDQQTAEAEVKNKTAADEVVGAENAELKQAGDKLAQQIAEINQALQEAIKKAETDMTAKNQKINDDYVSHKIDNNQRLDQLKNVQTENKNQRQAAQAAALAQEAGARAAARAEETGIKTKHADQKANIDSSLAAEKTRISQERGQDLDKVKDTANNLGFKSSADSVLNNWTKELGEKWEKFNPNKLTINAAKRGIADIEAAKKQVANLGAGNFDIFDVDKKDLVGAKGLNNPQEKFWSQLLDSSEDSEKALKNIVSSLEDLKSDPAKMANTKNQDLVNAWKMGMAAWEKKKEKSVPSSAEDLKDTLSSIDANHKSTKVKVDDFKDMF